MATMESSAVSVFGAMGIATILLLLLAAVVGFVFYVMYSLSLYQVARRRQIKGALAAWVPVLNFWLMGRISDHYRRRAKQTKTRRALTIVILVLLVVLAAVLSILVVGVGAAVGTESSVLNGLAIGSVGILAVDAVLLTVLQIVLWVCLYDVFASCRARGAAAFLLLSMFFPVLQPILVFSCRRHDMGLPMPVDPPVEVPADRDIPAEI